MDISIIKEFTKTGSTVGFIFLIIYLIVENLFKEPIYQFFGSEKVFIFLLVVFGLLFTAMILHLNKKPSKVTSDTSSKVIYKDSTHNGDNRF